MHCRPDCSHFYTTLSTRFPPGGSILLTPLGNPFKGKSRFFLNYGDLTNAAARGPVFFCKRPLFAFSIALFVVAMPETGRRRLAKMTEYNQAVRSLAALSQASSSARLQHADPREVAAALGGGDGSSSS